MTFDCNLRAIFRHTQPEMSIINTKITCITAKLCTAKCNNAMVEFVDIERRLYMHLVLVKFSQSVLSDFWKGITYETSRSINQTNKNNRKIVCQDESEICVNNIKLLHVSANKRGPRAEKCVSIIITIVRFRNEFLVSIM